MKQHRAGGNTWPRGPPVIAGRPARTPARMTAGGLTRPAEPPQNPNRTPTAPGAQMPRADLEIARVGPFSCVCGLGATSKSHSSKEKTA